jgi:hypothetical protein
MIYLAADQPLAADQTSLQDGIVLYPLSDLERQAIPHLTKPHRYKLGIKEGCGCVLLPLSDDRGSALATFARFISSRAHATAIEMLAAWAGDETKMPVVRRTLAPGEVPDTLFGDDPVFAVWKENRG